MTPDQLQRATGCTPENAAKFADPLSAACAFYGITTPVRLAAFLAQIGHESGALRYTTELWGPTPAQQRYEGRADLGNTQPGDGARFKGRGLIQTTGRHNYAKVRDRLRERFPQLDVPDFEAEPERLAEPQWAALSAADYWDMRGLNALADAGDFVGITRKINGGTNGLADRLARWKTAKAALGVEAPPTPHPAAENAASAPEQGTAWPFIAPIESPKESTMPAPFIWGLASSLINVFAPLARDKITKEVARHGVESEVAAQIANGVIDTAKQMTGLPDPVDAVAAAKAEPSIVQAVETDALATLDRLAPLLDKMHQWERDGWAASEASMDAAATRARGDPNDQDVFMTRAIVGMVIGLMLGLAILLGLLAYLKASEGTIGTVLGLFSMAVGIVAGEFKTRYQHRYGSSRSSGAKDVVIGELSRRPRA